MMVLTNDIHIQCSRCNHGFAINKDYGVLLSKKFVLIMTKKFSLFFCDFCYTTK